MTPLEAEFAVSSLMTGMCESVFVTVWVWSYLWGPISLVVGVAEQQQLQLLGLELVLLLLPAETQSDRHSFDEMELK